VVFHEAEEEELGRAAADFLRPTHQVLQPHLVGGDKEHHDLLALVAVLDGWHRRQVVAHLVFDDLWVLIVAIELLHEER
jgi:hypothetical protein